MIRVLIDGYAPGIRSERPLCEEVHLNLAYRWFCRLGLDGAVPDHSTFSKKRHGRFCDSDLLRELFETTIARCIDEGLVGGEPPQDGQTDPVAGVSNGRVSHAAILVPTSLAPQSAPQTDFFNTIDPLRTYAALLVIGPPSDLLRSCSSGESSRKF